MEKREFIGIRVSEKLKAQILLRCIELNGIKISEYIRNLIKEDLEKSNCK